jgi:hypothetical protein
MKGVLEMMMLFVAAKIAVGLIVISVGILQEIVNGIVLFPSR